MEFAPTTPISLSRDELLELKTPPKTWATERTQSLHTLCSHSALLQRVRKTKRKAAQHRQEEELRELRRRLAEAPTIAEKTFNEVGCQTDMDDDSKEEDASIEDDSDEDEKPRYTASQLKAECFRIVEMVKSEFVHTDHIKRYDDEKKQMKKEIASLKDRISSSETSVNDFVPDVEKLKQSFLHDEFEIAYFWESLNKLTATDKAAALNEYIVFLVSDNVMKSKKIEELRKELPASNG